MDKDDLFGTKNCLNRYQLLEMPTFGYNEGLEWLLAITMQYIRGYDCGQYPFL